MSQENVEIVRQAFAGFAEHGIEGGLPFNSPDVVTYSMPEWPDDSEYHGHDGLRKLTRQWTDNFDDFGFEVRELRDAGDSVVALLDMTGLVKGSEIPVNHHLGSVHSGFREGVIGQVRYFSSWQGALEAAGLSE